MPFSICKSNNLLLRIIVSGFIRFVLRNKGLILDKNAERLPKIYSQAGKLLKEMVVHGEIARVEVSEIINKSERTGRTIIKDLLSEVLIKTRSQKGTIRLGFPAYAASYFFPNL